MIYLARNITQHPQPINYIDGSCIAVSSGDVVELDEFKIYKEEMERIRKFFLLEKKMLDMIISSDIIDKPEVEIECEITVEEGMEEKGTYDSELDNEEEVS